SNRLNQGLLIGYFIAGLIAIGLGQKNLTTELANYQIAQQYYQQDLEHYHSHLPEDALANGYIGYYLFHPVVQTPNAWSTLFRGERDETAHHLRVRLLGLQSQVNASAPGNVEAQRYGQFDLAFLWLYLMPLVIAAMSINTLADEKSSGRWPMLAAQMPNGIRLLFKKMAIPSGILALTNLSFLLIAVLFTPIELSGHWLTILVALGLYQLCWLAISAWIVLLNKPASINYLAFLGIWLLFTFVVPGLSYLYQINQQNAGEDAAIVFDQRQYMNDSWDKDKQADFAAYLAAYPQWTPTAPLGEEFDWRWYYSQQQMSDNVVAEQVERREQSQLASYQQGQRFAWLSPVMSLQYAFNRIADTDMLANVSFNQQVRAYHQALRDYSWSFYFADKVMTASDIDAIPRFSYESMQKSNTVLTLIKLLLITGLFIIAVMVQIRRFHEH
ncbi:hypothetical protein LCGC14_2284210, partial [marine sediment metagenome]